MPINYKAVQDDDLVLVAFTTERKADYQVGRGKKGLFAIVLDRVRSEYSEGNYHRILQRGKYLAFAEEKLEKARQEEEDHKAVLVALGNINAVESVKTAMEAVMSTATDDRMDAERTLDKAKVDAAFAQHLRKIVKGEIDIDHYTSTDGTPFAEIAPTYGEALARFVGRNLAPYDKFELQQVSVREG